MHTRACTTRFCARARQNVRAQVYASCARVCARIFTKLFVVVQLLGPETDIDVGEMHFMARAPLTSSRRCWMFPSMASLLKKQPSYWSKHTFYSLMSCKVFLFNRECCLLFAVHELCHHWLGSLPCLLCCLAESQRISVCSQNYYSYWKISKEKLLSM